MSAYLINLVAILIGSAIGGAARYWIGGLVNRAIGETFPWGTMVVNVSGAILVGMLAAVPLQMPILAWSEAQALLIIGLCGSYTTVSSFALQTLMLLRDGQRWAAAFNVAGSLALCLAGVWIGFSVVSLATGGTSWALRCGLRWEVRWVAFRAFSWAICFTCCGPTLFRLTPFLSMSWAHC
jgi:fluoride exporter